MEAWEWILIIFGILIVLGIIGVILYFVFRNTGSTTTPIDLQFSPIDLQLPLTDLQLPLTDLQLPLPNSGTVLSNFYIFNNQLTQYLTVENGVPIFVTGNVPTSTPSICGATGTSELVAGTPLNDSNATWNYGTISGVDLTIYNNNTQPDILGVEEASDQTGPAGAFQGALITSKTPQPQTNCAGNQRPFVTQYSYWIYGSLNIPGTPTKIGTGESLFMVTCDGNGQILYVTRPGITTTGNDQRVVTREQEDLWGSFVLIDACSLKRVTISLNPFQPCCGWSYFSF